jgi:STE24 endopeptidase
MQWLTWAFLIALAAETLTRLWLGSRQIAAVQAHRDQVPAPFRGQIALADQQKAADYTAARVRLGRWATIVEALVKLALTWAAPRFIAPLFNRFSPLTDQSLKERVETLLNRCGFAAHGGVFVMDGSLRSAHGNAYFTGIGRNKRIVFFDTLLSRIEAPEIEAVLAHELGHFRLHHVRQRLVASVLLTFGGLALLAWAARQPGFYGALGVPVPSAAMALLLFVVTVPVFAFFSTPVMSWWSRRHERQADDFAAEHADAGKLAAALVKLFRDNAATLTPDRIHSAFFDSHPPALERIGRLNVLASSS